MQKLKLFFFILAVASAPVASRAQDRTEIANRSNKPWTLALVEGLQAGRGTLSIVDKFTKQTLAILRDTGDSAVLSAQGNYLLMFDRDGGYYNRNFILKDTHSYYAEYNASVEFLSSKQITIQLVNHHIGPPMNAADEGTIKQYIGDSIEFEGTRILIHPNGLASALNPPDHPGNPLGPDGTLAPKY